ncbi:hypothetical protein FN976_15165 [Caenimonas sedimenti]|uniref:Uncharacterized protein n=1 Tax=Caenimonas sedimenti TaxID=2596921 RepID=A0A562ZPJ5_9BURK|nr:DUF5985 family protein [Caenimonas sedimenti]TWO70327.1 hypothetical protein FN976_15165 [Caenimonas sedimenti]
MAALIYSLCALTCLACSVLLWRSWAGSRHPLLFWSGICFTLLTLNNALLVLDKVVYPVEVDLTVWRLSAALVALVVLVGGMIWEEDQ